MMDIGKGIRKLKERFSSPRSKEYFPTSSFWFRSIQGRGFRDKNLLESIYKDKVMTPHEEMWEIEKTYRQNAFIVSAVELMRDIILGKELSVNTDDDATREWYEEYFKKSNLKTALAEAIENFLKFGNGYIQALKGAKTGMYKKYTAVARAWAIWKLPITDEEGNIIDYKYIEEFPAGYSEIKLNSYEVYYTKYKLHKRAIKGIEYNTDIIHLKWGISDIPEYGRSPLASSLNDAMILREIERAMAVISRYKAIPRKLLNVLNPDGSGVSQQEINDIINYLDSISDIENPVIGSKKVEIKDLGYSSQSMNFSEMIDYLKRKLTSAFAPDFYIHGDITTYAVALEQKNIFYLRVMAIRQMLEKELNNLLEEIRIQNNTLPKKLRPAGWIPLQKATIKFGEFDFDTKQEERVFIFNAWNAGLITINEARKALGFDELKEEFGDAFKWEITQSIQTEMMPLMRGGVMNAQQSKK